jgi:hypothetical protein
MKKKSLKKQFLRAVRLSVKISFLFLLFLWDHIKVGLHSFVKKVTTYIHQEDAFSRMTLNHSVSVIKYTALTLGIPLVIISTHFFLGFAATNEWVQTTWIGGVGTNNETQFESEQGIRFSVAGEISLEPDETWPFPHAPYRTQLTIEHESVLGPENLFDFPFLVSFTDARLATIENDGTVAQADGGDIFFTTASGIPLNHTLVNYNATTGALEAWVRLPEVSTSIDTVVFMYHGDSNGNLSYSTENARPLETWNFDGIDDTITIENDVSLEREYTEPFSISLWVYPQDLSSRKYFVTDLESLGNTHAGWAIFHDPIEGLSFLMQGETEVERLHIATGTLTPARWWHIVVTYDGSGQASGTTVRVNNVVQSASVISNTLTSSLPVSISNNDALTFGALAGGGNFFDGEMTDIILWDEVLTSEEQEALFNLHIPRREEDEASAQKIIDAWRGEGTQTGALGVPSIVGNARGTLNTMSSSDVRTTYLRPFLENTGSVNFEGVNDYIEVYSNQVVATPYQTLSDNFAVSFWLDNTIGAGTTTIAWTSAFTVIELRQLTGTTARVPFSIGVDGGNIRLGVTDNYTGNAERVQTTGAPIQSTSGWQHVVVSMNGDTWSIYVDGALRNQGTLSLATGNRSVGTGLSALTLGARKRDNNTATNFLNGQLAHVSVINTSLESGQVRELFNNGTPRAITDTSITNQVIGHWNLDATDSLTTSLGIQDSKGNALGTAFGMSPDLFSNDRQFYPATFLIEKTTDTLATQSANYTQPETFSSRSATVRDGMLVSTPFNTGDVNAFVGSLVWDERLTSNGAIRFQLRTAPDADGVPGVWSPWLGPTDENDWYTDSLGTEVINPIHADALDDQWIQYQAILEGDSLSQVFLDEVRITYVANDAPEFNADFPEVGAGGVGASQSTEEVGQVFIQYSVRDPDTNSGSVQPTLITPSFEYSLDGGGEWIALDPTELRLEDTEPKAVTEESFTIHTAQWNVRESLPDTFSTSAQVRVTLDDGEGGNNRAQAMSNVFIIDTAAPEISEGSVDASQNPAPITFTCTDDGSLESRIGKLPQASDGIYGSYTGEGVLGDVTGGSNVVVVCRDAVGNTSSDLLIPVPATPTSVFFQDISDTSTNELRLFTAWSVIPIPASGFSRYEVLRAVDGGAFELYRSITNRGTNFLLDINVEAGREYAYKIRAFDNAGSSSPFSATVSDVPDGQGGTDLTPPTLSGITASDITATSARISWNTDELSNSTVYFEAVSENPGTDSEAYSRAQGVPSFVLDNQVILSNLEPGTQYYFLATSADPSNNIGTAVTSLTFTTSSGPVISNVSASEVFNDQVTITWNTDIPASSGVIYADNPELASAIQSGTSELTTNHRITITGLESGNDYYFLVTAIDADENMTEDRNVINGEARLFTFNTTSDTGAPSISNVRAALVGETGATIAWTTNEGATSQVEWGSTPELGTFTTATSVFTTQHAVTLTGLQNSSEYFYRVISEDRAGNDSQDDNNGNLYRFTTLQPSVEIIRKSFVIERDDNDGPEITNLEIRSTSATTGVMTFTTDEAARSRVTLTSPDGSQKNFDTGNVFTLEHRVILRDLVFGTTYVFSLEAWDTLDNRTERRGTFIHDSSLETESFVLDSETRNLLRDLADASSREAIDSLAEGVFENLRNAGIALFGSDNEEVSEEVLSIINPQFTEILPRSATLTWQTTRPARGVVEVIHLGTNEIIRFEENSIIRNHVRRLEGLSEETGYTARITVEDEEGNQVISGLIPFSTRIDTTPLTISEVRTNSTLIPGRSTNVQTIISWKTNKPASGSIFFTEGAIGASLDAGRSIQSNSFTTDHVLIISEFRPGQIYRIQAESRDRQGNATRSQIYSIITPQMSENIIDVIIENIQETFGVLGRRN